MTDRIIRNETDLLMAIKFIESRKMPFTISIRKGADRTVEQNKLQRLWLNEAAEQLGDQTAEELRGYWRKRSASNERRRTQTLRPDRS